MKQPRTDNFSEPPPDRGISSSRLYTLQSMSIRQEKYNEKLQAIREDLAEWINSLLGTSLDESTLMHVSSILLFVSTRLTKPHRTWPVASFFAT